MQEEAGAAENGLRRARRATVTVMSTFSPQAATKEAGVVVDGAACSKPDLQVAGLGRKQEIGSSALARE